MKARPYQVEAVNAADKALRSPDLGPACVSLPTGSGKTVIFALLIKHYITCYPGIRVLVLVHRKELVKQAVAKLEAALPPNHVGVYSAALDRRETWFPVTVAGIQSIYKRGLEVEPFNVAIIDEAHLIPPTAKGMYHKLFTDLKVQNPYFNYLGFTATCYRLKGGLIYGEGKPFAYVCYRAGIRELIEAGYLCRVTSKWGMDVDVSQVPVRGGEFVNRELSKTVDRYEIVSQAVAEAVRLSDGRLSTVFYCCGEDHAQNVSKELAKHGKRAPVISSKTPQHLRDAYLEAFTDGRLWGLVNIDVLTTGNDIERIDCIVMLRPTMSPGLYVQIVGRGLRLHEEKENCLVLDFAGNVERHGPLDMVEDNVAWRARNKGKKPGKPPVKVCPSCRSFIHAGLRECTECGHIFPEREIKHYTQATAAPIISRPQVVDVDRVSISVHKKKGKPNSLKVSYWSGLCKFSEYVCMNHDGPARFFAIKWWRARFTVDMPTSPEEACKDLFIPKHLEEITERIRVVRNGRAAKVEHVFLKGRDDA